MPASSMNMSMRTIDFINNHVRMLDQIMNLQFTTSAHYIVPIAKIVDHFTKEEILLLVNNNEHLIIDY